MGYEAFVLTEASRASLLEQFPPKFPDVIAHHITHRFGVHKPAEMPAPTPTSFEVVGYAADDSLEALVVRKRTAVGQNRPDGKPYHITWSLDRSKGRKPVDSNAVIANGFEPIDKPVIVAAQFHYID
jgi:hypothetical protein